MDFETDAGIAQWFEYKNNLWPLKIINDIHSYLDVFHYDP